MQGVPPALRGHRPAWRDPRLWIGIALVATSVVVGARVLAAADDTVQVWATASDLGAGQRVSADGLVAERVRFADPDALEGYFTVDDELPADLELTRSVAAGELLPRRAVGTPQEIGLVEMPIAVEPELVPPSIGSGDVVDVYVVAPLTAGTDGTDGQGQEQPPDGPALTAATVVDAPELAASFGTSGRRQLVLAVPEADAPGFFALLARYDSPSLTVVRRGLRVVLLLAAGAGWETRALGLLNGRRDLVVLKRCVDVEDLLATAASGQADTAVVAVEAPGFDLAAADHLRSHGVRTVAVAPGQGQLEQATVHAARIGVRTVVADDDLEALAGVVAADSEPEPEPEPEPVPSPAPTSGERPGRSRYGVRPAPPAGPPSPPSLAAALARTRRTTLVDADPYGGTVAQVLGILDEVSGLLAAARLAGAGMLEERLLQHPTRARRIRSPSSPDCPGPTDGPRSGPAPSSCSSRPRCARGTSSSTPVSGSRTTT